MMKKKYIVTLTGKERESLRKLTTTGKVAAATQLHARILLKADANPGGPNWPDGEIASSLDTAIRTVERVRQRFVEEGLEAALSRRRPRREYERRLDGAGEAHLIALACSSPPEGRERWTLQLLADRMVVLGHVPALSDDTVGRVLKKTRLSRG
jgi:hypothetical protein